MTTISEICDFLEAFAPSCLAEDWDNVGLIVGHRRAAVHRVMTCLTLTPDVAEEAVAADMQLIVSHHPLMFRAIRQVTDSTTEGRTLLRLIEQGIAVYSPHTAFDSAGQGINQQLAADLQLQHIQPLQPAEGLPDSGGGRWGRLSQPVGLSDFLELVARSIRADRLEFVGNLQQPVETVAVACGAAESFLPEAIRSGCDTFLTGESRFHSALEARARGVTLILTGHYPSERPAVENLARQLQKAFPEVIVAASEVEANPLQLWTPPSLAPRL